MQRGGFTKVELVVVLGVVVLLTAVMLPLFKARRDRRTCLQNIQQVALSFRQYMHDTDNLYPPTNKDTGWAGNNGVLFFSWHRNYQILQCPREGVPAVATRTNGLSQDPKQPGYTDYWLNAHLYGLNESAVRFPYKTLLLGEGNDGIDITDAGYSKTSLPPSWLTDTSKPSFRHSSGAHYVFADGHVKWLKPQEITTKPAADTLYTFAVK